MKLFIFGSTGDLVKRKALPALHKLFYEGGVIETYAISRKHMTNGEYSEAYCVKCKREFKSALEHIEIDFDIDFFNQIENFLDKDNINYFYISLPPSMTNEILNKIREVKNKRFKVSILLEKPFGEGLDDAISIRENLGELEKDLFLADHYLFKEEILQLKNNNFKKIEFIFLEELGLEGRKYYDSIGVIKDMVQSHFLNIISKTTPSIIKDLKFFSIEEFKTGQYDSYSEELGKESTIETFVDLTIKSKEREFRFISGKGFSKKESYIKIDDKKIIFNDSKNSYEKMFRDFFESKRNSFPTINDSLFSWKLISWILKNKPLVKLYKKGIEYSNLEF